jgi:pimeloyl-ACP methyl ester carboxylesterase
VQSYEFVELVDRLDASMEAAPKSSVRTAAQAARVSAMMAKSRANALDLCQKLYPPAGKAPVAPSAVGEQVTDKRRKLPTQKECSEILGLLSDANKHMLPAGSTMPSFIHTPKGAKGGAAPGQGAARPGAARQGAARQGAVPGKAPGGAKPKPRFSDSSMEAVEQMVADAEAQALATGARVRIQPIVFVHGIWSKPARWADFANMLNAKVRAGTLAACFNTHSWNFADLDAANVAALKTTITSTLTLCKDYLPSADPNVILVTHSKGGLISRAYLRQYPEPAQSRVSGLYFIGTPNCGSPMADFYMEQENPLTSFDHCAFALGGLAGRTRYAGCARRNSSTRVAG